MPMCAPSSVCLHSYVDAHVFDLVYKMQLVNLINLLQNTTAIVVRQAKRLESSATPQLQPATLAHKGLMKRTRKTMLGHWLKYLENRMSYKKYLTPGAHPASYTMSTGSLPGVKRPGCGVGHPTPSWAEVKE